MELPASARSPVGREVVLPIMLHPTALITSTTGFSAITRPADNSSNSVALGMI